MAGGSPLSNDSAIGYSIWLIPFEVRVSKRMHSMIKSISRKYNAPEFKPHVTLIGNISAPEGEVIKQASFLAEKLKPQHVRFGKVGQSDEFFKAIFVGIEDAPRIIAVNNTARKIFKMQKNPKYIPHLSIMYSNLPNKTKKRIIKEYDIKNAVTRLKSFTIKRMVLYSTKGRIEKWRKMKEFKLKERA